MTTNKVTKHAGHPAHATEAAHTTAATEPLTEHEAPAAVSEAPAEAEAPADLLIPSPALNITMYVAGIPTGSTLVNTTADIPNAVANMNTQLGTPNHSCAVFYQDQNGSGNGWSLIAGTDGNGAANMPS